jgi:hypothetical protein
VGYFPEVGVEFFVCIPKVLYLLFRYYKAVAWVNRSNVEKYDTLSVFVDPVARKFTFDNFGIYTIFHSSDYTLMFGTISSMKRVVKGLILFIASSLYAWLLFLTASGVALRQTFIQPTTVKSWLASSGVYGNIVDEVSKLATIQQKQEASLVQITAEDITANAKSAFTSDGLQLDGEKVIDGFYSWFQGKTSGPEFVVDFSARQAVFARLMRTSLQQKIATLPECATANKFVLEAFDPFKADCRPKGVDLSSELDSFEKEIATSKSIVPTAGFSGADIKVPDSHGHIDTIGSALPWVPTAYTVLDYGPFIAGAMTVFAGLTMIFMSTSKRKGFSRFASGLLFTGVVLILSGYFLRPAFERLNGASSKFLGGQASFTQNIVDPIFYEANKSFSKYSIIFGFGYTIPAIVCYGVLVLTRHKSYQPVDEPESTGTGPNTEDLPTEMTVSPPDVQQQAMPILSEASTTVLAVATPVPEPIAIPRNTEVASSQTRPVMMITSRPPQRPVVRRAPRIQG